MREDTLFTVLCLLDSASSGGSDLQSALRSALTKRANKPAGGTLEFRCK